MNETFLKLGQHIWGQW